MAKLLFLTTLTFFGCILCSLADERKVYIAYMGALPENNYSPTDNHLSILQEVLENGLPSDTLIHSYKRSFNGFAANLTEKEREKLESTKGIISVFPSIQYKLLTTRSWDFVGLTNEVKRVPEVESDVIVGIIDTGICPDSDSFSDHGIGPPPKKWKGVCNASEYFTCYSDKSLTCNNKIIGARYYTSSGHVRDTDGHGTHTASIAAGRHVNNVSFYGLAQGNAKGGVPSARIAVYSVCDAAGCDGADILAAFDDAISDGVDILSVSLGSDSPEPYTEEPIAIGSFHAMRKGILISQAAGNSGPNISTVSSNAPWILSVAASSTDRTILNKVVLGDNTTFVGRAVNAFDSTKELDLISGNLAKHQLTSCDKSLSRLCPENELRSETVDGKIVFYNDFSLGDEALAGKAAGMIVSTIDYGDFSIIYPLPATLLHYSDAEKVKSYINRAGKPVVRILKSEVRDHSSAPVVVSISSRGPNKISPYILKPDITAPGSEIIAAWSPFASASTVIGDVRFVNYNIMSGTSMACPHATGAAAYVKSFHPDWSPAAIKSALMTTAYPLNTTANPDAELAYGAGHIDPIKAINPGLVYDANDSDYVNFLCSVIPPSQIEYITGDRNTTCPKHTVPAKDLNYPTMTTNVGGTNFTRTVTNVGTANSIYKVAIISPPQWKIIVEPNILSFKSVNEKKSFVVTVLTPTHQNGVISSGSLTWSDGIHRVRSPIVVIGKNISSLND